MRLWGCVMALLLATTIGCQSSSEKRAERAARHEAKQVKQLEAQICELEQQLANERQEMEETLDRLRTNREQKLGRLRDDLRKALDTFNAQLEEMRIAKGGRDE